MDFKNTIIILTSNIGSARIMEITDKKAREEAVWMELKQQFRPEFLNRLDDVVVFNPLGFEQIVGIVDNLLTGIRAKLAEREITIELTDAAKAYVAKVGFDPVFGARPLKRALYSTVEDTLAELILKDEVAPGSKVLFDVQNDELITKIM